MRYQALNAMLLNEVQKQHAQLAAQEARIQRLEALLERQAVAAPKVN